MLKYIAVAAFVFVFAGAGICGSGKRAEPVTDAEFLWLATAAAKDANLTIDDFPAAWDSEPPDPDDDDDDDDDDFTEDLSPECLELFESFEGTEAAEADEANPSAESDDFSDPVTREGVSTEVEVYRTIELATEAQAMFDEAFETCGDDMGRAIEKAINAEADSGEQEFRIENLQMLEFAERDIGDWAADWGFSLTYDFGGMKVDATLTFTVVRAGRMAGTFFHFQLEETDAALVDSMREVFADRMAKVDATLPE